MSTHGFMFMPDDEYFNHPALDQTMLKHFMNSPRDYYYAKTHTTDTTPSYFNLGKAAHSVILGSGPIPTLKPNLRTKAGKEQLAALEADGLDRVYLNDQDMQTVSALEANRPTYFSEHDGQPEIAMFAQIDGVQCKGKADWLPNMPDADGIYRIADYKTVNGSPTDFAYDAYKYGYHIQAAFYMRLYRALTDNTPKAIAPNKLGFTFIVQSKQASYDWQLWQFDEAQTEIEMVANPLIDNALEQFAWWTNQDEKDMSKWGLDKTPQRIEYTQWQLNKLSEAL